MVLAGSSQLSAQEEVVEPDWDHWVEPAQSVAADLGNGILPNERRVRVLPRNGPSFDSDSFIDDNGQRITAITSPVNIIINNVARLDTVDIAADRLVVWSSDDAIGDLQGREVQPADLPLEFYLEGNIVFREGQRTIFAERMYYNVQTQSGVILNGEMLTPIMNFRGLVRLKAEVIQRLNEFQFEGTNAGVTTSRMGVPRYWLQSGRFTLNNVPRAPGDLQFGSNPQKPEFDRFVNSRNNLLFLGSTPVFYWPSVSANLTDPTYYLKSFSVNNDRVFGTQVLTGWDLYQLLGVRRIRGTEWTGNIDYLSERGLGIGSEFNYEIDNFLNRPGNATGFLDVWGINDDGQDNLGRGRRNLTPEEDFRGRIYGRHRHDLPGGFQFNAEIGYLSDRDFLEAYYEEDWDQRKDYTTGAELKRTTGNRSWSVTGDLQVNDFFTQTEWLPRLDHFTIGESILSNWLSWTEHSSLGYAHLRPTDAPLDPRNLNKFDLLPWETDSEGLRATTRHEVSLPFDFGMFRIVPYALGEASHWHEDLTQVDVDRLYGQLGVRTSLPMWSVDSAFRSTLFNMNGIAHKVVFDADLFWADANENFDRFPLYDKLDDDAIEAFRRRLFFDTFGGVGTDVPLRFDERTYALRSNLQGWVTSPSTEIADDLAAVRIGVHQRWQTKRGLPGQQHIVDFMSLNIDGFAYPDSDRDNFGQELGLLSYDFKWHPGDRFTLMSDGQFDLFSEGLRTIYMGAVISRPTKSKYSVGLRSIEGPISSQILISSANYRVSEKWIVAYGSSYDFGRTGNLGQSGKIIRVGESFLVGLGFNYDSGRDNLGFRFSIEPRFLAGRLSRLGGIIVPPTGVNGLE